MNDKSSPTALQTGYELHWYKIENVLGQGAFGITYLAHDVNLDRQVAIKEYLPDQFAVRNKDLTIRPANDALKEDFEWGLKRFVSEAKILTKFEHPNLVRVFNVFEMNNTAYMVMNYELGKSLHQILKNRKTLNESELLKILIPLLDGLEIMHEKGFVHRDIKPGNIFIRQDGSPVLLDFGSARQTRAERGSELSEEQQTVTTLVSPGYAPIEQYGSSGNRQGPWTDIYGLGATLYKAVTGKMPLAAVDRSEMIVHDMKDAYLPVSDSGNDGYSEQFLAAIDHAMAFKAGERPQDVVEWRTEFGITEDDIPTMPVSSIQNNSDFTPTVKLDPAQETNTIKIDDEAQQKTEKINISRPLYLQAKWQLCTLAAISLIIFGLINLTSKKEAIEEKEITHEPIAQTPPELEQSIADETLSEESETQAEEEQNRINELLMLAEEDISALRLTRPKDNNAMDKYLAILMMDENNTEANEGIRSISDKYISLAYAAMQSNNLPKAGAYIENAKEIYPNSDKIAPALVALQTKLEEQKTVAAKPATEKIPDEPQQASDKEESEGVWDSIKKWNENNEPIQQEESEIDKKIKGHFR